MAKALCSFVDDNGQLIMPGDEVFSSPGRLLCLVKFGLINDEPASPPWKHPAVVAAAAAPKPEPRVTIVPRTKSREGSRGRRLILAL